MAMRHNLCAPFTISATLSYFGFHRKARFSSMRAHSMSHMIVITLEDKNSILITLY